MALTTDRIKELSKKHLIVVGAGYVRPLDTTGFARAIEAEARRDALEEAAEAVEKVTYRKRWLKAGINSAPMQPCESAAVIRKLKEDIQ